MIVAIRSPANRRRGVAFSNIAATGNPARDELLARRRRQLAGAGRFDDLKRMQARPQLKAAIDHEIKVWKLAKG